MLNPMRDNPTHQWIPCGMATLWPNPLATGAKWMIGHEWLADPEFLDAMGQGTLVATVLHEKPATGPTLLRGCDD